MTWGRPWAPNSTAEPTIAIAQSVFISNLPVSTAGA
jgi:hypothetical protein